MCLKSIFMEPELWRQISKTDVTPESQKIDENLLHQSNSKYILLPEGKHKYFIILIFIYTYIPETNFYQWEGWLEDK